LSDFTVLHALHATRSSHEKAVCRPSVCLSLCQTRDLWQKERKLCSLSYTVWKTIYPSFPRKRIVGGGYLFYLKFWIKMTPLEQKQLIFNR